MTINNQFAADFLYAGGWRASDRDDLIAEYGLSEDEADEIVDKLSEMESDDM